MVFESHGNACLTVHGRRLIVQRFEDGQRYSHMAAAMGVTRKCVSTWIARYQTEGEAGPRDRSSRPPTMPTNTFNEVDAEALSALGLAPRTVSRILHRHGVAYLSHCDPVTGDVIRTSKATAERCERARPGDLVHMDVQKLGKIPDGGGWRAHGRAGGVRDNKAEIGYDYVHSLVDDHSRLTSSEILPDENGSTCANCLRRATAYFADKGTSRIERVLTDNAFAYQHPAIMRRACAELCARQKFIKPHCDTVTRSSAVEPRETMIPNPLQRWSRRQRRSEGPELSGPSLGVDVCARHLRFRDSWNPDFRGSRLNRWRLRQRPFVRRSQLFSPPGNPILGFRR